MKFFFKKTLIGMISLFFLFNYITTASQNAVIPQVPAGERSYCEYYHHLPQVTDLTMRTISCPGRVSFIEGNNQQKNNMDKKEIIIPYMNQNITIIYDNSSCSEVACSISQLQMQHYVMDVLTCRIGQAKYDNHIFNKISSDSVKIGENGNLISREFYIRPVEVWRHGGSVQINTSGQVKTLRLGER